MLGVVQKLLGYDRVMVKCADGQTRLCRIRGKMKRRVWVRDGDIVIVAPWDFQSDTRGDIIWRYTGAQADELKRSGELQRGVASA
jgi:translation initiation factor 1A